MPNLCSCVIVTRRLFLVLAEGGESYLSCVISGVGIGDDMGVNDVSSSNLVKVGSSWCFSIATPTPFALFSTLCADARATSACVLFVTAISRSTL